MHRVLFFVLSLFAATAQADWKYHSITDEMTSKKNYYAQALSEQSLDLNFPYSGRNFVKLAMRQKSNEKTAQVMIILEKGQFQCLTDCWIEMRFDDGPVVKFLGETPADNSSDQVFLTTPMRFVSRAAKATTIKVRFPLFQNGEPIVVFSMTSPLAWNPEKL